MRLTGLHIALATTGLLTLGVASASLAYGRTFK